MMLGRFRTRCVFCAGLAAAALAVALLLPARMWTSGAYADDSAAQLPPVAPRPVDFDKDVKPILANHCANCHGGGKSKGDFRIDTRADFIKGGGNDQPAVVPNNSAKSKVIHMVAGVGVDDDQIMPQKGKRLTPDQIGVLRAWIDQGLKWPDNFTFAAGKSAPLAPRAVPLPANVAGNPIDVILSDYFAKHGVASAQLVDDRVFARRAYLDVVGLLPPVNELDAFAADPAPDKRDKLVHRLLNDNPRYTEHWLSFWNDLLRNDYKGTGYIDGGRKQISAWLYKALNENLPFDRFVRDLITGANGSEGFIKGIVWRGVVNSAQTPQMQAAQNVSQVFMGANLKCASCHDSFVSQWKLADAYGLAGVFADKPLEMERCNVPLGQVAEMKFLYPELGSIDPKLPLDQRRQQLATMITSEKNGRLARTIVNRLWKQFLGRGLVEPVDEMDHEAWNQDLLDYLAHEFATTDRWDLKKTMARILTSRAYQMPVVAVAEGGKDAYVFRGPAVKRLTAEQFTDGVATITGVWTAKPAFDPTDRSTTLAHRKSKWIWSTAGADKSAAPGTVYLRKEFDLDDLDGGEAIVAADNAFVLYVNGQRVATGDNWKEPQAVDFKAHLRSNEKNVIAVEATNTTDKPNPAGFFAVGAIRHRKGGAGSRIEFITDKTWLVSTKPDAGWNTRDFDPTAHGWHLAAELGDDRAAPWRLTTTWNVRDPKPATTQATAATQATATTRPKPAPSKPRAKPAAAKSRPAAVATTQARAALCLANPLTTALGRTNREQVTTDREKLATTLQALELSNGATLSDMLQKGAAKLAAETGATPDSVTTTIYRRALGRPPTPGEITTAKELLGSPMTPESVEDLLWITAMLPEFQLIR